MTKRRALIVHGGWEGHDPAICAEIYRDWLAADGFDVRVETSPAAFLDPELPTYSLIVPIYTMAKIEKPQAQAFAAAIASGVGLGGHHGGMCDAFRDSVDYQFVCGGQWVAHPGNIIDYRVNVTKPDDPIMAGIRDFDYRSEQYYMHVDPAIEVLATTTFTGEHAPWTKGVVMPVTWKKKHGEGRVFYCSLGHRAAEFAVPEMATMIRRGINWAAR